MKKILIILLLFSVMVIPTSAVNIDAVTTINIGFLTPRTGALSVYNQGFENAGTLAFNQVQAAYPGITFSLNFYDTRTTPEGATTAMTQAIADGATFVVGAAGSSMTLAAATQAKVDKIPLISYASTSPELTTFDDDGYLFRVAPSDAFQGKAIVDLANDQGYGSALVLYVDNVYGIGVRDTFTTAFDGTASSIGYDPNSFDESVIVTQIAAVSPDVIIAVSYGSDGSRLFVEMYNQGLNIPVIGADGVSFDGIYTEDADTQISMIDFLVTKQETPQSDAVTTFQNAYAAAGYSGGIYTGEAFDAVWVGVLAVVAADSNNGTLIRNAIYNVKHDGGSGYKEFDANGDILGASYSILKSTLDGFTEIGTWRDGILTVDYSLPKFKINVGLLTPQTGALSAFSPGFENAAKLALEHLQRDYPDIVFNYQIHNTKTTPEGAQIGMGNAIRNGSTFVVGAAGSTQTLAAADIAKNSQIPLISYSSTSPRISSFDDDGFLWRVVASDAVQMQAMADFANFGEYGHAAIVYMDNSFGLTITEILQDEFTGTVSRIAYSEDNPDTNDVVNRIISSDGDVLFLVTNQEQTYEILNELDIQEYPIPIIAINYGFTEEIFSGSASSAILDNFMGTKILISDSTEANEFASAYSAAGYSQGIFIRETYDAVMVGALATIAANSTVGVDIIAKLALTDYSGASGHISFDTNGDRNSAAFSIVRAESGKLSEIGTWIDGTLALNAEFIYPPLVFVEDTGIETPPLPFVPVAFDAIMASLILIPILRRLRKKSN